MSNVSPVYYAGGTMLRNFEVTGYNLDRIPSDAIGLLSKNNNNPLEFLDASVSSTIIPIADSQPNIISLRQDEVHNVDGPSYLGCIVSADRTIVYWTNNTNPLP